MIEVLKVGGSVLKSRNGFAHFLKIVQSTKKPSLVIVSAFAKVTRSLNQIAETAAEGNESKAISLLQDLFNYHKKTSGQIISEQSKITDLFDKLDSYYVDLAKVINGLSLTKELSPRIRDIILSYGELMALDIIGCFLQDKKIRHQTVVADKVVITDSNFGAASPNEKATSKKVDNILKPALEEYGLVVMQGFVARSSKGEITTMGIESSNLTAALLAKLLGSKRVTYWTDVKGIRNADPALVGDTILIHKLNYDDAEKAGSAGLKLIYPPMIDFVSANQIELVFKSAFEHSSEFTSIKNRGKSKDRLIVVHGEVITLFNVHFDKFSIVLNKKFEDKYFASHIKSLEYDECSIRLSVRAVKTKKIASFLHQFV